MNELGDWALWYADAGWPVLPLHSWTGRRCSCGRDDCASPAKHPRTPHGLKEASTDPETVTAWWTRWPEANIGLRTGVAFDVIDIDGEEGFAAIEEMERAHGAEPPGPTSLTGGGGAHRLFQPTGLGNRAGLLEHVDWRGKNGYIVAPPSLHASGERYEWHEDWPVVTEIVPVNGWLQGLLFPPVPERSPAERPQVRSSGAYARRAFDAELGELARAQEGTRNNALNDAAFNLYQLVFGRELEEGEVTEALGRVALGIGLGEHEVRTTLASARTGAEAHPRSAPRLEVIGNTAAKPEPVEEPGTPRILTPKVELKLALLHERLLDFEALKKLPPPTWRIHGILPTEGLAVLYGHPGTYKSFVALDWANCTAVGCPWKGREVSEGFVLYIIAESPAGMSLRAEAWEKVNKVTPANIRFLPLAVNLLDPEWAQAVAVLADELGADLSIVDTLSRAMVGANENAPESMTLAVDNADKLRRERGATVLVHHKPREGANPRGHTALEGAVDTMIETEASDFGVVLHCQKAKNAEPFDDIRLVPTTVILGDGMSDSPGPEEINTGDSLTNSLVLDVGQLDLDHTVNDHQVVQALSSVYTVTGATAKDLEDTTKLAHSSLYASLNRLLGTGVVVKTKTRRYLLAGTKGVD